MVCVGFMTSVCWNPISPTPPPQRPAVEQKELTNKWNEMGTDEPGLKTIPRGLALSFWCGYASVHQSDRALLAFKGIVQYLVKGGQCDTYGKVTHPKFGEADRNNGARTNLN